MESQLKIQTGAYFSMHQMLIAKSVLFNFFISSPLSAHAFPSNLVQLKLVALQK
jgi:hypothetical protein